MRTVGRRFGRAARVCAASVFAVVAFSAPASAYDLKKTPSGGDVRWRAPSVTFHIDASVASISGDAASAIRAAAGAWSGLHGAPDLAVVDGGGGAEPGYDGVSTIFYAPGGSSLAGGALAVTVLTFDDTGRSLDADIVINGRYPFAVLPSGALPPSSAQPLSNEGGPTISSLLATSAPFDVRHVVAHELGHTLGLADETDDRGALMYLYTSPGDASRRGPASDDAAGITSLYDDGGAASSASGCGGSTVSPRAPSRAADRAAFALALGLAAWIALRTRRSSAARALLYAALAVVAWSALPDEHRARSASVPARVSLGRARVTRTETRVDGGLLRTRVTLQGGEVVEALGGSLGGIHQEIGGEPVPREGDVVDLVPGTAATLARIVRR